MWRGGGTPLYIGDFRVTARKGRAALAGEGSDKAARGLSSNCGRKEARRYRLSLWVWPYVAILTSLLSGQDTKEEVLNGKSCRFAGGGKSDEKQKAAVPEKVFGILRVHEISKGTLRGSEPASRRS